MARIFSVLASFAVLLLLANIGLGFWLGDMGRSSAEYERARSAAHQLGISESATAGQVAAARAEKDRALAALSGMRRRFQPHVWLGIAAALVTVLVNCISVTYFIGTSRWCREVVDVYQLDSALARRSRALKRASFPGALAGMLATLAIVALGAASDPGASLTSPASWVVLHTTAALLGTVAIAAGFHFQAAAIHENFALIQQILAEAERVRRTAREPCTSTPVAAACSAPSPLTTGEGP